MTPSTSISRRQEIHQILFFYGLVLLILVLPFNLLWSSWVFIALVINWVFEGAFGEKWQRLKNNPQALFFMGFFFIHLLSYLNTDNMQNYGGHLEKKIAFLGYPLIFASINPLTTRQLHMLLKTYVLAIFLGMGVCLSVATRKYLLTGDTSYFFYHELSQVIGLNAIYMATYVSFAAFVVLYFLLSTEVRQNTLLILTGVLILSILIVFVVLLSSKTILISFPLLLNVFLLLYLFSRKIFRLGLMLLVFNVLLIGLFTGLSYPKQRFQQIIATDIAVIYKDKLTYEENNALTGVSVRLLLWRFAQELLNENQAWLGGLGIGDAQDALNRKIAAANLYTGDPSRGDTGYIGYNCHNQYVEMTLILGVLGLVYLLTYFGTLLYIALRRNDQLFSFFICLIMIICLSESFLETNKGIIFFNLFIGLFAFHGQNLFFTDKTST